VAGTGQEGGALPPGGAGLRYGDPWAAPPEARDPVRRLRGHLVFPVTVWLAASPEGCPVGLTISSVLLAPGEPSLIAGLVSPATDLGEFFAAGSAGSATSFVVHVVGASHRRLAQHFSGELPGESVAVSASAWGFVLDGVEDRLFCRARSTREFGWSLLVEAVIEAAEVGPAGRALAWYHGEYRVLEA
jgi:3-hydroxy-9,10-secoandrosta-1,3,5(10)-triene-9,17-dione monooxygenase reductase component